MTKMYTFYPSVEIRLQKGESLEDFEKRAGEFVKEFNNISLTAKKYGAVILDDRINKYIEHD